MRWRLLFIPVHTLGVEFLPQRRREASKKEFSNQVVNVIGFCIRLSGETGFYQTVQFIRVELLLGQRIQFNGFSENGERGKHPLLFSTEFGENFNRDIILKRFMKGSRRGTSVNQFKNEWVASRKTVDVEPLFIFE